MEKKGRRENYIKTKKQYVLYKKKKREENER